MAQYSLPKDYINRELSWLDFNLRVLSEARNKHNPLFERLKFLAITCSNLDEFFMVRVASLKDMVHAGYQKPDPAGLTPESQLDAISEKTHKLVSLQYRTYLRSLLPQLEEEDIVLVDREHLSKEQRVFIHQYFKNNVYPVLTPMAVDSSRPFPLILNQSLNICALIKKGDEEAAFATVQVPSVLDRMIALPSKKDGKRSFILLEQIIEEYLQLLFIGYDVLCAYPYRIMRNADLPIDEEEAEDLLQEIQKQLRRREWGEVIRLEVEEGIDSRLLDILKEELEIGDEDVYKINGPLDLTFLNTLYRLDGYEQLKYPPYTPQFPPRVQTDDLFSAIREGDILLHHPFDSFDPVVNLIKTAAHDPNVLAIKQTLYRVSGNSPIIKYLSEAAENGKQITVLVELKARFDEENNIIWAKKLEQAGCHVIYGLLGLKTHSKITIVVRREEDGIRRYVHLGTGNYNDITARFYTDLGLLTCSEPIGEDATAVFNMLSGFSEPPSWNKLILAPIWLRKKVLELIERERKNAEAGKPAKIIAKMNSLVDPEVICALYRASQSGVKIDLIVRGICCLRAQVPGLSDNIHVRSIIGRYLEHSRIFYFYNDGWENLYLSSADWMQRNLDRRVEIMFPIEDKALKDEVMEILTIQLSDTMRAHVQTDGLYERIDRRGKPCVDCQISCQKRAEKHAMQPLEEKSILSRTFVPIKKEDEME